MAYPSIVGIPCTEFSPSTTTGQIPIPAGNPGDADLLEDRVLPIVIDLFLSGIYLEDLQ